MTVAISEDDGSVLLGDVREQLQTLAGGSVQCVVTSPPYFGLRAYSDDPLEIGREQSPALYVEHIREVAAEIWRVLADDGTFWLNIGDTWYSGRGNPGPNADDKKNQSRRGWERAVDQPGQTWGRRKSLLGIPWRVALALMDDGWTLRNDVIWHKPNAMPESAADRLSSRHEHVFLLTKGPRYAFDLDPIKVPTTGLAAGNTAQSRQQYGAATGTESGARRFGGNPGSTLLTVHETRNPGDVWSITTTPFPGDHPACMSPALARRCILAGCPEGGTVLDPFAGAGTTLMVARSLGRRWAGIELNPEYIQIIRGRIGEPTLDYGVTS